MPKAWNYSTLFTTEERHLKALVFLYAFEESADCHLLSSFCDDSNLRISLFKYVLSTMGVSKESISEFLIGNRFHVKLRILSPYSIRAYSIRSLFYKDWGCVILREIDFLLKICWSIPCLHPSWKVNTWTVERCEVVMLWKSSAKIDDHLGNFPSARAASRCWNWNAETRNAACLERTVQLWSCLVSWDYVTSVKNIQTVVFLFEV